MASNFSLRCNCIFAAMRLLNFPKYNFRFKNIENKAYIFCSARKKFILLTPEEWVRQNCLKFILKDKAYPLSHINVEKGLTINGLQKRYDIVIFNSNGSIHTIIECKAPEITVTQETFDQIARYNMALDAQFLMVTNGLHHYFCQIDKEREAYRFLKDLPTYSK